MNNRKLEITIDENSSRDMFKKVAEILKNKIGVTFFDNEDIDADYINYIDTVYWDFIYKNVKFTLHLEHYTGISLLLENSSASDSEVLELNDLADKIKKYLL